MNLRPFFRSFSRRNARPLGNVFSAVADSLYDSVLFVDASGSIVYVNRKTLELFGYTEAELRNQKIELLIPESLRERHKALRDDFLAFPHPRLMNAGLNLEARKKDGTLIPVDISLTPVQTNTGVVVAAVVRDISKRQKIEQEYRFLAESLSSLIETTDYHLRLQKIADLLVPSLADFCVVFEYDSKEFRANAIAHRDPQRLPLLHELTKTANLSKSWYRSRLTATTGIPQIVEEINPDFLKYFLEETYILGLLQSLDPRSFLAMPLKVYNKTIGAISLFMAESGRHFSPSDLDFAKIIAARFAFALDNAWLYENARQAIRAREDILSIVSHDLKNPLAAIDLSAQLLSRIGSEAKISKVSEVGERIHKTALQMSRLIQSLLNFGRIEANSFVANLAPLKLDELLVELKSVFEPIAEQKSISLTFDPCEKYSIESDKDALLQILSNLLSNALKFTPRGGSVKVSHVLTPMQSLRFSISDTGPGIAEQDIKNIFQRFWQPQDTRKQGSGLGLYIAKMLVSALRGQLTVESHQGCGSIFTIEVPIQESAKRAA